jgi:predicted ATP-dependent endonuclease of OLD family
MQYVSFHIENYKAIECVDVPISRNVIPLIGINESGKTSILHAILAFDKTKDHLLDGAHIEPKNKYKNLSRRARCVLQAKVVASSAEEAIEIIQEANLNTEGALYSWCMEGLAGLEPVAIQRVCNEANELTSKYLILDAPQDEGEKTAYARLEKAIINRLPNILYFDDFSDRVPSEINFPKAFYAEGAALKTRGQTREWQEIVKEIFDRALDNDLSLEEFCKIEDEDERLDFLDEVAEVLNQDIISEWKTLKAAHAAFDEAESDSLKLSIKADKTNSGFTFKFKVEDTEAEGHNRRFDITNRSKGFQWFFNFIVKLKFNPKYKEHPNDAIYLLDEPGSYLHSSAQEELLKKLVEISQNNTILFCTHSQYLLDPEVINLNDVRIVSKSKGIISITNYGEADTDRNGGAYSALNDALHLKYGFPINPLGKVILVEGVTDWCFYSMFLSLPDVTIIPGAGCGQLRQLISILIATSDSFLVVLDKDNEGDASFKNYSEDFGELFTKNAYQYNFSNAKRFVLESLLDPDDINRIKETTNCKSIKKAFIKLYYSEKSQIESIKNQMEDTSLANLKRLEDVILAHFF